MITEYDQVKAILEKHKVTSVDEIEYGSLLFEELYEYYLEDMPYGTAKARDGDPTEWITMRVSDLGILWEDRV